MKKTFSKRIDRIRNAIKSVGAMPTDSTIQVHQIVNAKDVCDAKAQAPTHGIFVSLSGVIEEFSKRSRSSGVTLAYEGPAPTVCQLKAVASYGAGES